MVAVFPLVVAVLACGLAVSMLLTRGPSEAEVARLQEASSKAGYERGVQETEERMDAELRQAVSDARDTGREQGHRDGMTEGQKLGREQGYAEGEASGKESGARAGYEAGYSDGFADGQSVGPEMTDEERLLSYMNVLDCMMDPSVPQYLCSQID